MSPCLAQGQEVLIMVKMCTAMDTKASPHNTQGVYFHNNYNILEFNVIKTCLIN